MDQANRGAEDPEQWRDTRDSFQARGASFQLSPKNGSSAVCGASCAVNRVPIAAIEHSSPRHKAPMDFYQFINATSGFGLWSEITIMPGDFPIEQNVFHLGTLADVVYDHEPSAHPLFPVYYDADVRYVPSEVPGDQIARGVILRPVCNLKRFSFAREEHHEVRHAPVINIRIWMQGEPCPFAWIG
jgi:hypothetical protein